MHIVQLMASPFFGGPERQMLGLARALPRGYRTSFLSFSERGLCGALLKQVRSHGFAGIELQRNFPDVRRAVTEVVQQLRRLRADVICCSGYKPDLIGLLAGKQLGIPVVSVSHGWTAASWKVRLYESFDRFALRWMDAVVCVSEGQAAKVRRTKAPAKCIHVIRNAVSLEKFGSPDPRFRQELLGLFRKQPERLIGAAGRLSPEKGMDQLVEAAARLARSHPAVGFVIFGEGPLRKALAALISDLKLRDRVVLAGFRNNLEDYLPHFDMVALPSYTEGLPVVILEAFAARVPVVATAVGGVPEIVDEGKSGHLVSPGDANALADSIVKVLSDDSRRRAMGEHGRQAVEDRFTFAAQSLQYQWLFHRLCRNRVSHVRAG